MIQMALLISGLMIVLFFAGSVAGGIADIENIKSCLLVFGGTILCGFLAFPISAFGGLIKSLHAVFRQDRENNKSLLFEIETLAHVRWLYGIRELESEAQRASNLFLRRGIEFVVDDYQTNEIADLMQRDFDVYLSNKTSQINILNTLAKLAPALGFVGTIIGLISVLNNMHDSTAIGEGMSLALLTTLYGSLISHFLFLPLSKKLVEHTKAELVQLNIIKEGVVAISEKKNPKVLSHRLQSYLTTQSLEDALYTGDSSKPKGRSRQAFFGRWAMRKEHS